MQRLQRKFETAKARVPQPVLTRRPSRRARGVIWFGSTGAAMAESLAALERQGIHLDRIRLRAFPFADASDFMPPTSVCLSSSRIATRS